MAVAASGGRRGADYGAEVVALSFRASNALKILTNCPREGHSAGLFRRRILPTSVVPTIDSDLAAHALVATADSLKAKVARYTGGFGGCIGQIAREQLGAPLLSRPSYVPAIAAACEELTGICGVFSH